ncbi:peptidase S1/S6 [Gluconobacter thailandicus F149-1 = NBRC 100600]|uniref:Serine protease n=1 Tax=Gluconobacter thailandicus NBRC 3257 TaxID=1381097 RepID=A0ABQ0IYS7_GLUTH|nr:trypsin-like serine protease [Gluconobacter thailandicus]GAN89250.1 peptidase S1/S6 [Gluconobacter frateurii M-2]KXV52490.1 protease [Gluconobacter thailandicus]GAC87141.1 protease [Gluconobacter thailandicus NBRC 3255]GAD27338.1 protease [Gluconobacter thailandicus NBRC 3257]GAN92594.1 peptidase S1/S6 [Gluconobacter thailandicus F149-1 = NBRC 100600]
MKFRSCLLISFLELAGLGGAGHTFARPQSVLPGLGDGARRELIDVNKAPWRILARVQTELGVRCTGFAVAPTVVMTAAHCLWLPATHHYIQPKDIHVLMGYARGGYRQHAQVARFVIPAGYDPANEAGTASNDRATLLMDHPVAVAADLLPAVEVRDGMSAMLVGYPQDRSEVPFGDVECHINGVTVSGLVHHDCEATKGVSGAPLLVRAPEGAWGVGALAVGADVGPGGLAAPLIR